MWEGGRENTTDGDRYLNLVHCFYGLLHFLKNLPSSTLYCKHVKLKG